MVECASGRLKGRWCSLLKCNDVRIESMTTLVTACCILHNICEVHQDSIDDHLLDEEVQDSFTTPATATANSNPSSATAFATLHALCDYIDSH